MTIEVCARCNEEPRTVWGGSYGVAKDLLRCACGVDKAVLVTQAGYMQRREKSMIEQSKQPTMSEEELDQAVTDLFGGSQEAMP